MPYLFILLLIANIATLGYFLFLHDGNGDTANVAQEREKITQVVDVADPK